MFCFRTKLFSYFSKTRDGFTCKLEARKRPLIGPDWTAVLVKTVPPIAYPFCRNFKLTAPKPAFSLGARSNTVDPRRTLIPQISSLSHNTSVFRLVTPARSSLPVCFQQYSLGIVLLLIGDGFMIASYIDLILFWIDRTPPSFLFCALLSVGHFSFWLIIDYKIHHSFERRLILQ